LKVQVQIICERSEEEKFSTVIRSLHTTVQIFFRIFVNFCILVLLNSPSFPDRRNHAINRRHNSLFGHVAKLQEDAPAHKGALNCHIALLLGRPPSSQWSRRSGRPCNRWVDQIPWDNNLSPADLWRRAISRGHRGAMLRPLLAKH